MMGKIAILPIDYHSIYRPINFKKQILLFDKIILVEETLALARSESYAPNIDDSPIDLAFFELSKAHFPKTDDSTVNSAVFEFNNQNIEFLANKGLLEFEHINSIQEMKGTEIRSFFISFMEKVTDITSIMANSRTKEKAHKIAKFLFELAEEMPGIFARVIGLKLRNEGIDAYPIFENDPNYAEAGKKEQVLKFILSNIPEPDDSVSWEQILDFRKDPATLRKYYAMIDWVNEVARGELNLNEIEEKYKALYYDYLEQYHIHKIKANQGIIEVLVTGTIDFMTNQIGIGSISTSFFKLWKKQINLLEAEAKFPGREIAYIHKIEQTFNQPSE